MYIKLIFTFFKYQILQRSLDCSIDSLWVYIHLKEMHESTKKILYQYLCMHFRHTHSSTIITIMRKNQPQTSNNNLHLINNRINIIFAYRLPPGFPWKTNREVSFLMRRFLQEIREKIATFDHIKNRVICQCHETLKYLKHYIELLQDHAQQCNKTEPLENLLEYQMPQFATHKINQEIMKK